MATIKPVLCLNCGAQMRKNGYCSGCGLHIDMIKKTHNTSDYYYNLGYDKARARDLSGAIDCLLTSLKYNKRNIESRNLLGLIYYETGEIVSALCEWVISVNYLSSGNLASRYLKELRSNPTRLEEIDQIARKYNMALGYANSGDYDLAIIKLKAVLADNPHFVKGYQLLALLYIHEGNYEKAKAAVMRILRIDRCNPLALHYLFEIGEGDELTGIAEEESANDFMDDDFASEINIDVNGKTENGDGIFKEYRAGKKDNTIRLGEFGEVGFAKYSGIYVLLGIAIGVLLLFFIVVPHQKKKLQEENDRLIKTYSEELADRESTINSLKNEVSSLQKQLEEQANEEMLSHNPLPDYSDVQNGMSDSDITDMINNE